MSNGRQRFRRTATALAAILMLTAVAIAQSTDVQLGLRESMDGTTAFTGARVVVEPGRVIEDATLVIRKGTVVSVSGGRDVPQGAVEVRVHGATIYPGFIDPYTDYGLPADPSSSGGEKSPRYEGERAGLASWNDALRADERWVDHFTPDSTAADKLLARGVTTVQSARLDGIFRGTGFVTSLGDEEPSKLVRAPVSRHFASFDPGSSQQEYPSSLMGSIALVRQTLLDAAWYANASRGEGERPEPNAVLEALAERRQALIFDSDDALSLLRAQRIAEEMGVPMIHVGSGDEYRYLDQVAAIDQPLILPATLPATPEVGSFEQTLDLDLETLRHWELAPGNAASLVEAGVDLAFTGQGLRDDEDLFANLRKMIEAGLSPDSALAALTTVPTRIAGVERQVGTLDPGKRADLVIVNGDLFDEEAEIVAVWVDGRSAWEARALEADDYRGRYLVTLEGGTWDLKISGEIHQPKAVLSSTAGAGGASIQAEGERLENGRLTFHARLPEGLTFFSLTRVGEQVLGRAAVGGGEPMAVVVTATGPADDESGDKGEEDDAEGEPQSTRIARTTYPAVAFGFETLPEPEDVLVRNATVWTVDEAGTLENADLLVRNGKIAAVGVGLDAPSGVRVIDATGKHVTPGMIDEHSHIAIQGGVNEGSHAVTAEVRIGDVVDPTDVNIYRNLAGGTTTAQLLHGSANPIGGQAQVVKLRWGHGSEQMKFDAAPPTIKFALGENVKQSNWGDEYKSRYPQTRMGVETLMRDRFLAARDYQQAWQRWNDGDRDGLPPRRDLQLETLAEILDSERFIHCHSYVQSEVLMLMRLAEDLGFRIQTFTHILEGYKVAPEMAAHGAGASTFSDWWAYKFEVYDAIPQNTCLMADAGVVTSINSDSSDLSRRLNSEAGKSVMHCGMAQEEAIKLATLNPAIQLKIDHRVGSLTPGKDADFVIWDGNPLSIHSRAEQTWVDGTLYFSRQRDAELREEVRAERQALIEKVLAQEGKETAEGKEEPRGDAGTGWPPLNPQHRAYRCDDAEDSWHAIN